MYASLAHSGAAIDNARHLARQARARAGVIASEESLIVQQVCAEAGIWAPDAATRALDQSSGDTSRAVALVRVWAATLPYLEASTPSEDDIELTRRLSGAFADIPGGQWLGASDEQAPRLLTWHDEDDPDPGIEDLRDAAVSPRPRVRRSPRRSSVARARDLLSQIPAAGAPPRDGGPDPTPAALTAPLSRLGRLAALARSETGALIAFASVAMERRREAILVEVDAALVSLAVTHPRTGNPCRIAEVPIVEAEVVADTTAADGAASFGLGYGVSLGSLERRAIAMAVLDATLQGGAVAVSLDDSVVLSACDGLASTGFVEHLRLPHYVSFAAYLAGIETGQDLKPC